MNANWIDTLPPDTRTAILSQMTTRTFRKGALVFARTETPGGLYLIRRGSAYSMVSSARGDKLLLRIMRENELFGETVALDGKPAPIFVEARTPLETTFLSTRRIATLARAYPAIERALAMVASANLRAVLGALEELVLLPLQPRLQRRLAAMAREGGTPKEQRECVIDVTQLELASMMGVSRQAVSVALRKLEAQRLIERKFRCIVCRGSLAQAA